MRQGFSFSGYIPLKSQPSAPVIEAQSALDAHEATCPGSHLECYGNPKMEKARRLWIERKDHFKALLRMAQEAEKQGWRDAQGNRVDLEWTPRHTPKSKAHARAEREAIKKGQAA